MSEIPMQPIVIGSRYPEITNATKQPTYVICHDTAQAYRQEGYIAGQQDLVAAGYEPMSHYRRRSPKEIPADGAHIVVNFSDVNPLANHLCFVRDEYLYSGGRTEHLNMLEHCIWWAYAWFPAAPQTTNKESKE